jgi:hypothetical protein
MKIIKRKNKFYDTSRFGFPEIRLFHKKGKGKKCSRYLLKCGDCNNKLEIYYDDQMEALEIGGVNGSVKDWQEILSPLLFSKKGKNNGTRDTV